MTQSWIRKVGIPLVIVTILAAASPLRASAADPPSLNARDNFTVLRVSGSSPSTAELRSRGYYPQSSNCLTADLPCTTSSGYKPEATAQAKVIQSLALGGTTTAGTATPTIPSNVQWEVAPGPDSQYPDAVWAPQAASADPPDPLETDLQANYDPACLNPPKVNEDPLKNPFRVDVMENESFGGQLGIFEVKDYRVSNVQKVVDDQLDCYVAKAKARGVTFVRDNRLNASLWSRAYVDNQGDVWCTWADEDVTGRHAGNIYFAPLLNVPSTVQARTPDCDADTDQQTRSDWAAAIAVGLTAAAADIVTVAALRLLYVKNMAALAARAATAVEVEPPAQETKTYCVGTWAVTVAEDAGRPLTLLMDFGDGTSTTVGIPAGTGSDVVPFSHTFPYGPAGDGLYKQTATLLETGASGAAVTLHPDYTEQANYAGVVAPSMGAQGLSITIAGNCLDCVGGDGGNSVRIAPLPLALAPGNPNRTQNFCRGPDSSLPSMVIGGPVTTNGTTVTGSGTVPYLSDGLYVVCADPWPSVVWGYFYVQSPPPLTLPHVPCVYRPPLTVCPPPPPPQ